MDVFRAMKGTPTIVATVTSDGLCARLNRFGDGSWYVEQNGRSMGCWEHHERGECLGVISALARRHGPDAAPPVWPDTVVFTDFPADFGTAGCRIGVRG